MGHAGAGDGSGGSASSFRRPPTQSRPFHLQTPPPRVVPPSVVPTARRSAAVRARARIVICLSIPEESPFQGVGIEGFHWSAADPIGHTEYSAVTGCHV